MSLKLSCADLFTVLSPINFFKGKTTHFNAVTDHSASVKPDSLFVAIPSARRGPEGFTDVALHKGAAAIITLPEVALEKHHTFPHATFVGVKDVRLALTQIARHISPQKPRFCAAITGTNGKTSIAQFSYQLWSALDLKAASLGTLGLQGMSNFGNTLTQSLTTLEPLSFYPLMNSMAEQGIDYLACEASSHGLFQKRLDGLLFKAGVFSSFSRDHLDYHGNMRAYWMAKARLFKDLMEEKGVAILNHNLLHPSELFEICRRRSLSIWTYGREGKEVTLHKSVPTLKGQDIDITVFGKPYQLSLPLFGYFQVENALAALLVVHASGVPVEKIIPLLTHLKTLPGRLEYVGITPYGGHVYVDYAHTPDALEMVLTHMRSHTRARLGVLFGCGGERDAGKRVLMGKIAAEKSDFVFITDDNPRHEDPAFIRQEILKTAPKAHEIPNRSEAIQSAIKMLQKDDILILAGKGHENFQLIENRSIPFNDARIALNTIKSLNSALKQEAFK